MTSIIDGSFPTPGTSAPAREPIQKLRIIAPICLLTSAWLGTGSGATLVTHDGVKALRQQQQSVLSGTSSASFEYAGSDHHLNPAISLRELQIRSGLTWNEFARALGVSRRTVHNWAAGKRLSERHARRVEELTGLILRIEGPGPGATRASLTSPRPAGRSLLSEFAAESQPKSTIPLSTITVGEFLDMGDLSDASRASSVVRTSTLRPKQIPPRVTGESAT